MGFLDSARNAAQKTKLRGEVALIDRKILAEQGRAGIELYDRLVALGTASRLFAEITEEFEDARAAIVQKENAREALGLEQEKLQVDRERALPATTNQESVQKAGKWVSSKTAESKIVVQVQLLTREIRVRKEQFGVTVLDTVTAVAARKQGGLLSGLNKKEKELYEGINTAARAVQVLRAQREAKLREIQAIEDGVRY